MKHIVIMLCMLPFVGQAIERDQLDKMLEMAANAQPNTYLAARTAITDLGTNALPVLIQAGNDSKLSWQQRLAARICCERLERAGAIETLRRHDWRQHPGYDARWEMSMIGPGLKMQKLALAHLAAEGLWYYYIEVTWKVTGELAQSPLENLNVFWSRWCRLALAGYPEEAYLWRAVMERLEKDELLDTADAVELYKCLRDSKQADGVTILVQRYDAFNKREATGLEVYPGAHADSYRGMFKPILSFADSRHIDLLEKFIADHPALAELKPKLADVRARPTPPPVPEPPFRLTIESGASQTSSRVSSEAPVELTKTNVVAPSSPSSTLLPPSTAHPSSSSHTPKRSVAFPLAAVILAGFAVAIFWFVRGR